MSEMAGQKANYGERVAALEKSETLRGSQLDRLEKKQDRLLLWTIGFDLALLSALVGVATLVLRLTKAQ